MDVNSPTVFLLPGPLEGSSRVGTHMGIREPDTTSEESGSRISFGESGEA